MNPLYAHERLIIPCAFNKIGRNFPADVVITLTRVLEIFVHSSERMSKSLLHIYSLYTIAVWFYFETYAARATPQKLTRRVAAQEGKDWGGWKERLGLTSILCIVSLYIFNHKQVMIFS